MEDTDIRFHTGIPVGHKFLAFILAAAVAGAGCAWLIYKSARSASAALLSFDPALAQHLDSGIASAPNPAVALAGLMLNDATVARLAKQAHLASTTPAGRIGEFRSDLDLRSDFQVSQPSAQRLAVRFKSDDTSESIAVSNAVAQALTTGNPASADAPPAAPAPTAAPAQAAAAATSSAPLPAPAAQGQSHPADDGADSEASQPTPLAEPPSQPPLSQALRKLGAQLTATGQQLDRLAARGSRYGSRSESRQQSLLRNQVHQAQRTLAGFHRTYAKELGDPGISARVVEIHQALSSVLPGGYSAGVSRSVLRSERSELRQTAWITGREAEGIRLQEAAHPSLVAQAAPPAAQPAHPAALPTPEAAAAHSAAPESSSAPATSSPAASSPTPASTSSSPAPVAEQNLPANSATSPAPQPSMQSPWRIVRLAAPAARPQLWPAIVAGILCGLLYLGIAALVYRRGANDDIYPELRTASRMITPEDSSPIEETHSEPPQPAPAETAPRHRASFVFQPAPHQESQNQVEGPAAPAEERLPL